jgi:drug/metabolite transporter (DMT)-like permease
MENSARNDAKGAFFVISGALCFAVCGGLIKYLTADMSWGMVGFLRHVFAVPFFLPMVLRRGTITIATTRPLGHLLRGAAGFTSFMLFVVALTHLPIGDAFSLSYTTPFWSMIVAAIVFGERVGPVRIAATMLGFLGVLLIVKPGGEINPYSFVALFSAALTCLAMMMVKQLSATEPPDRIAFWFIFVGLPLGAPLAAFGWTPPEMQHLPWLVLLGGLTWLGQRCLSRGYALGQFSKMSPLVFVQVAVATTLGVFVFGEIPDARAVVGMVLIALGAIIVVRPSG